MSKEFIKLKNSLIKKKWDQACNEKEWEDYFKKIPENAKGLKLRRCREINQAYQLHQKLWKELISMKKIKSQLEKQNSESWPCSRGNLLETMFQDKYEECKKLILNDPQRPGPVGNFPIHDCILLGQMKLAKELIKDSPELAECAYVDDLIPWKTVIGQKEIDKGLYTGETVLHMAIGLGEVDLVKFLLEKQRGAKLHEKKATGMFFMPPFIRRKSSENLALHVNEYSRCYYGAFPLSFAASVGRDDICEHIFSALLAGGLQPAYAALFFQDDYGNTALHMAVIHRRMRTIDWLLEREAEVVESLRLHRDSESAVVQGTAADREELEQCRAAAVEEEGEDQRQLTDVTNRDGLTALTLAARLGFVDVFHHVLRHMSGTAWEFGEVGGGGVEGEGGGGSSRSRDPLLTLSCCSLRVAAHPSRWAFNPNFFMGDFNVFTKRFAILGP
jgi:ankyrin repeat protein